MLNYFFLLHVKVFFSKTMFSSLSVLVAKLQLRWLLVILYWQFLFSFFFLLCSPLFIDQFYIYVIFFYWQVLVYFSFCFIDNFILEDEQYTNGVFLFLKSFWIFETKKSKVFFCPNFLKLYWFSMKVHQYYY